MRKIALIIASLSLILIAKSGFCISKEDSTLVETKVDYLIDLINSNSDSTAYYLSDLEKQGSTYAILQFKRLSGFRKIRAGKFYEAIRFFEEYINLDGDSLTPGSIDQINRIAMCYKNMSSDSGKIYYNIALKLAKSTDYSKGIADSYTGIAQIEELKGNYTIAMDYYLKVFNHFEENKDSLGLSTTLNNIGNLMYYQANYDKALEYYKKSAHIDELRKDKHNLGSSYGNIGMIYMYLKDLDSALLYNVKCMNIFEEMQNMHALGTIYNNIALVYYDLEHFDKSLDYQLKSKKIKEEINDKNGLITTIINIGNLYVQREDYENAKEYYLKGIEGAIELESKLFEMEAHKGLSKVYQNTKQYDSALDEYILYSDIEDSLNSVEAKNKLAELETQFETEQKEKEILLLESEKQSSELELSKKVNQRNIIIGISIFLIIILVFSYSYWRQKQLSNTQKIESLVNENKINYVNAMIEGQEAERKRLAQDLHDRVGSILSTMKLHLSSNKTGGVDKAQELLDESVEEIRTISHNLASISLVKFGLTASLESLCESISSDKLKVDFLQHGVDERLPSKIAIALYRCSQELINNIIKHANASKVTIQLQKNDDQVNLIVEDNGKGFDPSKEYDGIGLKNIKSRIKSINGKVSFDSLPQKGTTAIIDISLKA